MRKNQLKSFYILIMGLFIISCQSNSNKKHNIATTPTSSPVKEVNAETNTSKEHCDDIISHEFSYDALGIKVFKSDTDKIKSLFLDKVVLKMEKQTNSQGGVYYLYNFTDGVNKIVLYNNEGFYLTDADITNDRVLLNKLISFGMKKDSFLKLLKVSDMKCDTIKVVDEEYSAESIYIFKNGYLKELKMGQIVE